MQPSRWPSPCTRAMEPASASPTTSGRPTTAVRYLLRNLSALVLEANYDEVALRTSEYPPSVQRRIAGSGGHLSNRAAAELLVELHHPELAVVVLAHLSRHCNTAEYARGHGRPRASAGRLQGNAPRGRTGHAAGTDSGRTDREDCSWDWRCRSVSCPLGKAKGGMTRVMPPSLVQGDKRLPLTPERRPDPAAPESESGRGDGGPTRSNVTGSVRSPPDKVSRCALELQPVVHPLPAERQSETVADDLSTAPSRCRSWRCCPGGR